MTFPRFLLLLALLFPSLVTAAAAAATTGVAVAVDGPLFKDRTVVIVAGLPGDMESEKAYTDDAIRLLNLCNGAGMTPKKVLLLSNLPLQLDFETSYKLELLANDRKTFLGLGDKLKDAPPPVFIVFGHGGNQGNTPVFHVPGPRLTPADFSTVAGACPASTWLLFFPGSGFFAKALHAPQRTVLATEADDQHYNQDPISFGLLLGLLGQETDLAKLADKLGAATDRWYKDRSEARTEEPALWVNADAPRKLIVSEAAVADAAPSASGTNPPIGPDVAPSPAPPDAATPPAVPAPSPAVTIEVDPGTGLTRPVNKDASWKDIQPVKAADYPNADAVTLSRHESYQLDNDTQVTEEEETFVQILTRDGKRFGDFDFTFSPPEEDLSFIACEVRRPDGQIESLDPDAIRDGVNGAQGNYNTGQRKIFSLPHVEPGAILHLHLQREWKRFPFPHVFEEIPLASEIPTRAFKVDVGLPDKTAFHFKFRNQPSTDPAVAKTNYGSVYTWQFHDIPAMVEEPLRPSEQTPELIVTTFPDWASFGTWYSGLIRQSNQPSPEMAAQAAELAAPAKTDRDKIAAVTRFVTNFRYVAIPLGVNSYRPHAAVNVWQNRYGDCKDKANLLNTMLTTLGYKTSLVLVPRFSQAYDDLPGFAFNHAISAVQLDGQTLFIDSTDDVCRFGLLPPGDAGRKVLVVNDQNHALTQLPEAVAHDTRLLLDTKLTLADATGQTAQVEITAKTEGYADYLLRASSKALGADKIVPLLAASFYPTSGSFEPSHQESTLVADLDQNFSWKADGTWPGLVSHLPQSPVHLVRLPGWLPKEWSVAKMPRTTPLHLNEGYPMEIDQTWSVKLPTGASTVKVPAIQADESHVLAWKLSWAVASSSEVTAKLDLALLKADLSVEETRDFQASCHHLEEALQDGLSFQTP